MHTGLDTYAFWLANAPDQALRDEMEHIKQHAARLGVTYNTSYPYLHDYNRIRDELARRAAAERTDR